MRMSRLPVWLLPFGLFAVSAGGAAGPVGPAERVGPGAAAKKAVPPDPVEIEVRFTDDSTLRMTFADQPLELVTKHGTLRFAAADVRRIEFATRLTPVVADKIADAVRDLGSPEFAARERATVALKHFRDRAYPAVLKATQDADKERAERAEEVARYVRARTKADDLVPREFDVVHSDDSRVTGRLTAASLRVLTYQFGERQVRVADLRELRGANWVPPLEISPIPQHGTIWEYAGRPGKELAFKVTGPAAPIAALGQAQCNIWGTGVYTTDSHIATAAVHAGIVAPGQTAVVRVRVLQSPQQFEGSVQNNVTSYPYGPHNGAFEFILTK